MQVRENFLVVYVYAVSLALTDYSFRVCNNVTKIRSLWLTLWRNLCCHDSWISDGLMPSFDTNHMVHLFPDKCLPFCNCCPCAAITRLGNDISCFSLAWTTKTILWWNDVLRSYYPMTTPAILWLFISRNSSPCPNHFWMPLINA